MSAQEKEEFAALTGWVQTFPQIDQWIGRAKRLGRRPKSENLLADTSITPVLYEIASEICCSSDGNESVVALSGDPWDAILHLSQRSRPKHKRKSLEPPHQDTPHIWEDHVKYIALTNLLEGSVSHEDLQLRKVYIERIMGLPSNTQRSLMALLERRKNKSKTPRKVRMTDGATTTPVKQDPYIMASPSQTRSLHRSSKDRTMDRTMDRTIENNAPREPLSPSAQTLARQQSALKRKSIISKGRVLTASKAPRRALEESFTSPLSNSFLESSPMRTPAANNNDASFMSPGFGDSYEYERQIQQLQERNAQLEKELQISHSKEEVLTGQLELSTAELRKEMMQLEATAHRNEEELKLEYDRDLAHYKEELEELRQRYQLASQASDELDSVRDEMEILAHTKAQLADVTERVQVYKEKLEQLTDVKDALSREEEAHSKSVEECLRLENELKALQPLRRQLESYKERATESEVRLAECQDELEKLKRHTVVSSDDQSGLALTLQSQQEEIAELRSRLAFNADRESAANGLGEGISELNPQLKEEVLRLRNENSRYRDFAAKREDDAVVQLEQKLEDATRLADRFKQQLLGTKDQLENTQKNLDVSRGREARLREELENAMSKIQEGHEAIGDLSQQLGQKVEELNRSKDCESKLETELSKWIEKAKVLQEDANDLKIRLQARSNELDASKGRELQLSQEVVKWKTELRDSEDNLSKETALLKESATALDESRAREVALHEQLDGLTNEVNALQRKVEETQGTLQERNMQLESSRSQEDCLKGEREQLTRALDGAESKIEELMVELTRTSDDLVASQETIKECLQREKTLKDELADMTSRAEDSEAVSKQRMELVQDTREKLKSTEAALADLQEKETSLSEQLKMRSKKLEITEAKADEFEKKFTETVQALNEASDKLSAAEGEIVHLNESISTKSSELIEWQYKVDSSESLTERLQEELVQMRDVLSETQLTLTETRSDKNTMEEGVNHAEYIIFELEELVEFEAEARAKIENEYKDLQKSLATTKEDLQSEIARLSTRVQEESELCHKLKQDLFHSQETLSSIQGSLGASQQREKMLKLENSKLEADLTREKEISKRNLEASASESAKALESTREIMQSKSMKELTEIQANMNKLLEDERRAKRGADENHKKVVQEMTEGFNREIETLISTSKSDLEEISRQKDEEMENQRKEFEERLKATLESAKEENDKLISKGKGMLKDLNSKAQQERSCLMEKYEKLEKQLETEKTEKERIISQAKTKVADYKKKLQFSTSRISSLSSESGELDARVKDLEREKFKLSEENDRYRRQLGGRGGTDDKLQSQLELLQKEFESAMEETRELRRKLREKDGWDTSGRLGALPSISEDLDHSYSRDMVNQSTLGQLRAEYEETIESLNDEKRELVMKNSAAVTDVQKAEKRAWESEQENSGLKQKVTSLQLQVERLEQLLTTVEDTATDTSARDAYLEQSMSELSSIPPAISEEFESSGVGSEGDGHQDGGVLSEIPSFPNRSYSAVGSTRGYDKKSQSFAEMHSHPSSTAEGAPECKQC
eukprot:Nitzschia sp. Nitz4//scaffold26_size159584//88964//93739//NITZ4_002498-RA/size159584-snap-gene-0.23-mRNA-1//1//CDS//3329545103//992//frame0